MSMRGGLLASNPRFQKMNGGRLLADLAHTRTDGHVLTHAHAHTHPPTHTHTHPHPPTEKHEKMEKNGENEKTEKNEKQIKKEQQGVVKAEEAEKQVRVCACVQAAAYSTSRGDPFPLDLDATPTTVQPPCIPPSTRPNLSTQTRVCASTPGRSHART